jgi:hypothetical protein
MDNQSPSAAPVPKVLASTGGTGAGGVLAILIIWSLQQAGLSISSEVGLAIGTLCSMIVGFIAGYLTPPK